MAAEYSRVDLQTVAVDENVLFNNGFRACRKGFISHRDDSGVFFLKGSVTNFASSIISSISRSSTIYSSL